MVGRLGGGAHGWERSARTRRATRTLCPLATRWRPLATRWRLVGHPLEIRAHTVPTHGRPGGDGPRPLLSASMIIIAGTIDVDPAQLAACLEASAPLQAATRADDRAVSPTASPPIPASPAASRSTNCGPTRSRWRRTSATRTTSACGRCSGGSGFVAPTRASSRSAGGSPSTTPIAGHAPTSSRARPPALNPKASRDRRGSHGLNRRDRARRRCDRWPSLRGRALRGGVRGALPGRAGAPQPACGRSDADTVGMRGHRGHRLLRHARDPLHANRPARRLRRAVGGRSRRAARAPRRRCRHGLPPSCGGRVAGLAAVRGNRRCALPLRTGGARRAELARLGLPLRRHPSRRRARPDAPVCHGLEAGFTLTDELYCYPVLEEHVVPLMCTTFPTGDASQFFSADLAPCAGGGTPTTAGAIRRQRSRRMGEARRQRAGGLPPVR